VLTPKQLKSMTPRELKRAMSKRETTIVQYRRETQQLKREIEKRSPREVHFRSRSSTDRASLIRKRATTSTIVAYADQHIDSYPDICFEEIDSPTRRHPEGQRHRIHPRASQQQTRYPQDLCADEVEAWMVREGITHVISENEDTETTPESLAAGRYTRVQFIKWWRLLEGND
jgi:hypothetical protein